MLGLKSPRVRQVPSMRVVQAVRGHVRDRARPGRRQCDLRLSRTGSHTRTAAYSRTQPHAHTRMHAEAQLSTRALAPTHRWTQYHRGHSTTGDLGCRLVIPRSLTSEVAPLPQRLWPARLQAAPSPLSSTVARPPSSPIRRLSCGITVYCAALDVRIAAGTLVSYLAGGTTAEWVVGGHTRSVGP